MRSLRLSLLLAATFLTGARAEARTEELPKVVVNDLKALGGVTPDEALQITAMVRSTLTGTGKYDVLTRDQMDAIMKEMEFQQSDACDSTSCYAEIGSALGAEKMVAGQVGRLGNSYTVSLSLIDIAKTSSEGSVNKQCRCAIDDIGATVDEAVYTLLKLPVPTAAPVAVAPAAEASPEEAPAYEAAPEPAPAYTYEESPAEAESSILDQDWFWWTVTAASVVGVGLIVALSTDPVGDIATVAVPLPQPAATGATR